MISFSGKFHCAKHAEFAGNFFSTACRSHSSFRIARDRTQQYTRKKSTSTPKRLWEIKNEVPNLNPRSAGFGWVKINRARHRQRAKSLRNAQLQRKKTDLEKYDRYPASLQPVRRMNVLVNVRWLNLYIARWKFHPIVILQISINYIDTIFAYVFSFEKFSRVFM